MSCILSLLKAMTVPLFSGFCSSTEVRMQSGLVTSTISPALSYLGRVPQYIMEIKNVKANPTWHSIYNYVFLLFLYVSVSPSIYGVFECRKHTFHLCPSDPGHCTRQAVTFPFLLHCEQVLMCPRLNVRMRDRKYVSVPAARWGVQNWTLISGAHQHRADYVCPKATGRTSEPGARTIGCFQMY